MKIFKQWIKNFYPQKFKKLFNFKIIIMHYLLINKNMRIKPIIINQMDPKKYKDCPISRLGGVNSLMKMINLILNSMLRNLIIIISNTS